MGGASNFAEICIGRPPVSPTAIVNINILVLLLYLKVITILGETLQPLDEDGLIPAFGFGDIRTKGDAIFPLKDVVRLV